MPLRAELPCGRVMINWARGRKYMFVIDQWMVLGKCIAQMTFSSPNTPVSVSQSPTQHAGDRCVLPTLVSKHVGHAHVSRRWRCRGMVTLIPWSEREPDLAIVSVSRRVCVAFLLFRRNLVESLGLPDLATRSCNSRHVVATRGRKESRPTLCPAR